MSILALAAMLACSTASRQTASAPATPLGGYSCYLGNLHAHSIYSGDVAKGVAKIKHNVVPTYDTQTPAEVFEKAKACGYDFYAVTDHSSPEQTQYHAKGFTDAHWKDTKAQAEQCTSDRFVALWGFEFSRHKDPDKGGYGHMNVLNSDSWKSAYAPGNTFAALYDWMAAQNNPLLVAQFNHPGIPVAAQFNHPGSADAKPPAMNFNRYEGRTKARNDVVTLAEIWNPSDRGRLIPAVQQIWASGWKVAPTAGTDAHGLWGIEKRRNRTGILAKRLTRNDLLAALRARRAYATVEPRLQLDFRLNGYAMGTALERRPVGDLRAEVFAHDPAGAVIEKVEIYGAKYAANGGGASLLATLPMGEGERIARGAVANGYDFYYAQVHKRGKDTPVAFSSPIWMDNL
jgi:hypothetical protein